MTLRQIGLLVAACIISVPMAAWPQAKDSELALGPFEKVIGNKQAGIFGPNGEFGTRKPWVPDAARPIGYMVRNSLENPQAKLWNTAKQKLLDGGQIFSWHTSTADPKLYCEIAPHYDFIWVEMEHSTLTFADVERMIAACPRAGIPILRLADGDKGTLQRATDIGALGVIVNMVDDAIEARNIGRYSKYPPLGRRSTGMGQYDLIWGVNGVNYRKEFNDNMLTIVSIGTREGVANSYEIAVQAGVDMVMVSTNDLLQQMGVLPSDPRYQDALIEVHDNVLKAGKFFGMNSRWYITGTPISKDTQLFHNGPSKDGFVPPVPRSLQYPIPPMKF